MLGNGESFEFKLHARDYWAVVRNRWPVALLCFGMVLITTVVITYIMPQKYRGRVMVEVAMPGEAGRGITGIGADPTPAPISNRFVQNQFDIISSKEVLGRVVDNLDLVREFDLSLRSEAVNVLKSMVDTEL